MSWSYGADDAAPALDEVRRYLPVFEQHGYVAYEPQLGRLFDPDRDAVDAAELHRDIHRQLEEEFESARPDRGSFWKRWLP